MSRASAQSNYELDERHDGQRSVTMFALAKPGSPPSRRDHDPPHRRLASRANAREIDARSNRGASRIASVPLQRGSARAEGLARRERAHPAPGQIEHLGIHDARLWEHET